MRKKPSQMRPSLLCKAEECKVAKIHENLYRVDSPSGRAYYVWRLNEAFKCECEGFDKVGRCSHWLSVMLAL